MAIRSVAMRGVVISLMWVPAHTGVSGNEKVYKLAKTAVKKENVEVKLNLSKAEGKCLVWRGIMIQWQQLWERETKGRNLFSLNKRVTESAKPCGAMRRNEEVTIARLRIGHTLLNSTLFIVGKHLNGMCDECQQPETVPHVIIYCRKYGSERKELLEKMRELGLEDMSVEGILNLGSSGRGRCCFLKYLSDTGLMKRI